MSRETLSDPLSASEDVRSDTKGEEYRSNRVGSQMSRAWLEVALAWNETRDEVFARVATSLLNSCREIELTARDEEEERRSEKLVEVRTKNDKKTSRHTRIDRRLCTEYESASFQRRKGLITRCSPANRISSTSVSIARCSRQGQISPSEQSVISSNTFLSFFLFCVQCFCLTLSYIFSLSLSFCEDMSVCTSQCGEILFFYSLR